MENQQAIALITYETGNALFQALLLLENVEIVNSFSWSLN